MRASLMDRILKTGRRLGRPDILFWTLPWLMFLIVVGTIVQKDIGLYAAQQTYFSSFIVWFYGFPFPAGYATLGIMTLNLLCKFCFLSTWTREKIGNHLVHFSIILLMVGALLTSLTMNEGYVALKEGQSASVIRDYHDRALFISKEDQVIAGPFDVLDRGALDLPFEMKVTQTCENTAIRPRADLGNNNGVGAAAMAELVCIPTQVENEKNVAGVSYRVGGGEYIVFEGRETSDVIDGYTVTLDRAERRLPFEISLQSFRRHVYPGTNKPREYESRVVVTDGAVVWPALIAMNEPFRYGGYTFYQASTFMDDGGDAVSVLSVVKNTGWLFPYISGILLAFGLILHVAIRMRWVTL